MHTYIAIGVCIAKSPKPDVVVCVCVCVFSVASQIIMSYNEFFNAMATSTVIILQRK